MFIAVGAFAYNVNDYVYTTTARYKVTGSKNLVVNGSFTQADRTAADFGWKDATGANLSAEGWSVEPEKGPNGETVLESLSGAEGMTAYQSFPYEAGKTYVISFKIMGPTTATSSFYLGQNDYIDVFTNSDGTSAKTDEALQQIAGRVGIPNEWGEVTYTFTDAKNAAGMLVISLGRLATGTLVTDFQVVEAKPVYDIRIAQRAVDYSHYLLNCGEFTKDESAGSALKEILEPMNEILANSDLADDASFMEETMKTLLDAQQAYLNANSGDLISEINSGDISKWSKFNNNEGRTEYGDWKFYDESSHRWGHGTDAEDANFSYPSGYSLGWGKAAIETAVAPGRYMFAIDALATQYMTGKDANGKNDYYVPNYSVFVEGAKVFINGDTLECGTLDNEEFTTYTLFGTVGEDGQISAGIYFPGLNGNGGTFRFKNAVLRQVNVSQETVTRAFYVNRIATQQRELKKRIDQAELDIADAQYVWGKAGYTDSLAKANELYTASLVYVDAAGKDMGAEIPEAYDDLLLNDGVRYMNTSRNWFTNLNKPYTDLVAQVAKGKEKLADETLANASATSKAALEQAIADAETLISGAVATDEPDVEPFTAAYANIETCIFNFEMSCATFNTPASLIIQNPNFTTNKGGQAEGWELSLDGNANGKWKFHADPLFENNYCIHVSRGYSAYSMNKAVQKITVTEPGAYAYICQAYAVNTQEGRYNTMWNGQSGEDSLRISGIRLFFGAEGTPDSLNVCTNQSHFGNNVWDGYEVRWFEIVYNKTTSGEEVLEFGLDGLENGLPKGAGCNLYGFSSNKVLFYGDYNNYLNGITNAEADKKAYEDAPIYTLTGMMVGKSAANLPKGVYIKGGKKFVVNK